MVIRTVYTASISAYDVRGCAVCACRIRTLVTLGVIKGAGLASSVIRKISTIANSARDHWTIEAFNIKVQAVHAKAPCYQMVDSPTNHTSGGIAIEAIWMINSAQLTRIVDSKKLPYITHSAICGRLIALYTIRIALWSNISIYLIEMRKRYTATIH